MSNPAKCYAFFTTTGKHMEPLLADELRGLGVSDVKQGRSGAAFSGSLSVAYRACLWSRIANRVLLVIDDVDAASADALYAAVTAIPWEDHLRADGTLSVDFTARGARITHTRFGAQRVKDAVVDRFRRLFGRRPSVEQRNPELRINVFASGDAARICVDLSGDSLHRRGYRLDGVTASLKENLAAAILMRAGWPACAERGEPLLDPMCGAGTLPIEAALMAGDVAPGLLRKQFGFTRWLGHDARAWAALTEEAQTRRAEGLIRIPPIHGSDRDPKAVETARGNARRAGLEDRITFECRDFESVAGVAGPGLVVMNPPYGERMGDRATLVPLYGRIGSGLKRRFPGWRAALMTGGLGTEIRVGLKPKKAYTLFNGALECRLALFDIGVTERSASDSTGEEGDSLTPGAQMLANRLRKNLRTVGAWARREHFDCYRLYDADLPEYALALDVYRGETLWVHVQEYEAPRRIDPVVAGQRLREALTVITDVLELPPDHLFFKIRRKQRGMNQYQKVGSIGRFHQVYEAPCRFWVNFTDYLDTGLFLDHRPLRAMIRGAVTGKRFLNLFAYTGTATVHAAAGGARATTSVDMSRTYVEWAGRNLALNGFPRKDHELIRGDCLTWLSDNRRARRGAYDVIFVDPPSFSNSKRMKGTFDVQRDHVQLIRVASELLAGDGVLLFSTNLRGFQLDEEALSGLAAEDISEATIPRDFRRKSRIHHCFRIRRL